MVDGLMHFCDALSCTALLKKISDPSEAVVATSLEVMAKISKQDEYFNKLMASLVKLFASDVGLQVSYVCCFSC